MCQPRSDREASEREEGKREGQEGQEGLSKDLSVGSACRSPTHGFRSSGCAQVQVADRPPRSNCPGPHHGRQVCCAVRLYCGAHAGWAGYASNLVTLGASTSEGQAHGGGTSIQGSSTTSTQGSRGEQLPNLDVDLDTAHRYRVVLLIAWTQDSTSLLGPDPALRGSRILDGTGPLSTPETRHPSASSPPPSILLVWFLFSSLYPPSPPARIPSRPYFVCARMLLVSQL